MCLLKRKKGSTNTKHYTAFAVSQGSNWSTPISSLIFWNTFFIAKVFYTMYTQFFKKVKSVLVSFFRFIIGKKLKENYRITPFLSLSTSSFLCIETVPSTHSTRLLHALQHTASQTYNSPIPSSYHK